MIRALGIVAAVLLVATTTARAQDESIDTGFSPVDTDEPVGDDEAPAATEGEEPAVDEQATTEGEKPRSDEEQATGLPMDEPPPPPAAPLAPWRPIAHWSRAPSDRQQAPLRFRASLGGGASSNVLHLSEAEQVRFTTAKGGSSLSDPQPPWPHQSIGGAVLGASVRAAWFGSVLGARSSVALGWDGSFVPRATGVSSHPMFLQASRQILEGSASTRPEIPGPLSAWATLALRANPHDYQRPLPVPDPALHDPLPDRHVDGIRRAIGVEATGGVVPLQGLVLSPRYRVMRANYPDALDNWDATEHDLGLRGRYWILDTLYTEAGGGFASAVARGDSLTTTAKELDPSWAGTRWSLEAAWDTSGVYVVPWRARLRGDLVQRNFLTGAPTQLSHYDRRDVGLLTTAEASLMPPAQFVPSGFEASLSLRYTLDWNHTDLPPQIRPPDEGDYLEHRGMVVVEIAHDRQPFWE